MEQNTSSEIDPRKYNQLIVDKGAKATQWSKDNIFQKMGFKQSDIHMQTHIHTHKESRHRPYTLHKTLTWRGHRPRCKTQNYKTHKMDKLDFMKIKKKLCFVNTMSIE